MRSVSCLVIVLGLVTPDGVFAAGAAPLIGGWLASAAGYRIVFVVAFVVGLMGYALLRWWVREPRQMMGNTL